MWFAVGTLYGLFLAYVAFGLGGGGHGDYTPFLISLIASPLIGACLAESLSAKSPNRQIKLIVLCFAVATADCFAIWELTGFVERFSWGNAVRTWTVLWIVWQPTFLAAWVLTTVCGRNKNVVSNMPHRR